MSKNIFGNVFKDENRSKPWFYVIELGRDMNGKRKQKKKTGFKSQKEARTALNKMINEIESGLSPSDTDLSFKDYMDEFLVSKKNNVRKKTYRSYDLYYRNLLEYFGNVKLKDITPRDVQSFINYLQNERQFSNVYVRETILLMRMAMKKAVRPLKLISDNPCEGIELPKVQNSNFKVWTKEEIDKFVSEGRHAKTPAAGRPIAYHYYLIVATSVLTGMRKGEVLGLRWDDIDFESNTITISQTLDSWGNVFKGAKTKSSLRKIVIPNKLVELLKVQKDIQQRNKVEYEQRDDNNLVFTTKHGTTLDPRETLRNFKKLTYSLDLPEIRFHDLRHSHATLLLQQNVNVKIVSERLGHTDITTTLNTYSHVLPTMQQEVADKLDSLF